MKRVLPEYKKQLTEDEIPPGCKRCKKRNYLYWLLGVPFCDWASYTCRGRQKPCPDHVTDYGEQLSLF